MAGVGFSIEFHHPDFASAELDRQKKKQAEEAIADYIIEVIDAQIPVKTGQLKRSYKLNKTTHFVGPAHTIRKEGRLHNDELAVILHDKGYLNVHITDAERAEAARIGKRTLGSKPFTYRGKIVLK